MLGYASTIPHEQRECLGVDLRDERLADDAFQDTRENGYAAQIAL